MPDWQPGAGLSQLRARAGLLAAIRRFFAERDILEVETPLLCGSGITDPAIEPLIVAAGDSLSAQRYLQTSPEYAMKRLLAAGSGPIYQVARAFRDGEAGARHNPEFSLLEWYRPGFDHHALMAEVAALVCACLGERPWRKLSYRELFRQGLGLDPFEVDAGELERVARGRHDLGNLEGDRDFWLDLLLTHDLEPWLAGQGLCFVYDYPASQAALAQIVDHDGVEVGQRFELYIDGVELANGYHELTDAAEQRARFEADNARRLARGQPARPLDEYLLAALAAGMPACSGVALGVDRLLMLACGEADIRRVLAFSWERS
ncbi:EF-P lysine aminoacylase EpmA [Parahaliea mediterranea]|uniref:EF-P lysine aminoacylase GenX n=1 Tax=Parahaliea mediterranea TaxID=651086 RepID=A0A939DJF8_9GAMM|nr:EF-P lysine aminoacylase EpmA [Parahaliea mediterranea]MBN7799078.1 EF-P lysine aminoacylase GenX [Parahaliea mediterranea]